MQGSQAVADRLLYGYLGNADLYRALVDVNPQWLHAVLRRERAPAMVRVGMVEAIDACTGPGGRPDEPDGNARSGVFATWGDHTLTTTMRHRGKPKT